MLISSSFLQAASDGSFTVSVPITGGTTVLNAVAVSSTGATAHDQRSIVFDFTPGTVILNVTDPASVDNGPDNYVSSELDYTTNHLVTLQDVVIRSHFSGYC